MALPLVICLKGFRNAREAWPPLLLPSEPELSWWQELLAEGVYEGRTLLAEMHRVMPQLRLPQVQGISVSELYRSTVLRGEDCDPANLSVCGPVPKWEQPDALELSIAPHLCGAMPVLQTPSWHDFDWLVRALILSL